MMIQFTNVRSVDLYIHLRCFAYVHHDDHLQRFPPGKDHLETTE
jgi:hypothetical protein